MEAVQCVAKAAASRVLQRDLCSSSSSSCSSSFLSSPPQLYVLRSRSLKSTAVRSSLSQEFSRRSAFGSPASSAASRQCIWVQSAKKTYSSFDDLLKNTETAVLVDFYATWCGPCQFMVPILDDVGRALKDKVRVVKIDSEKYPSIASRFGVQALPTLILFQNGQPIDRLEGAMTAPELIKRIEGALSSVSRAK